MCIGAPFAMMELKIVLAMIVQRFRLICLPDSRVDYTVRITLRPKKHLRLQVHNQDRKFTSVPVNGNIHGILDLPN